MGASTKEQEELGKAVVKAGAKGLAAAQHMDPLRNTWTDPSVLEHIGYQLGGDMGWQAEEALAGPQLLAVIGAAKIGQQLLRRKKEKDARTKWQETIQDGVAKGVMLDLAEFFDKNKNKITNSTCTRTSSHNL